MQALPSEVVQDIVHGVDSVSDLASLSRTCQYLHAHSIPLIYKHTTINLSAVYASKDALSRSHGPLPPCLAQLQGMSRNSQGQCRHVQKLSVVNEGDWSVVLKALLRNSERVGIDDLLDERNGIQFLINCLLEAAIPFMERLAEFEWLVIAYPSNGIIRALSEHRLSAFTHLFPEDRYSLKQLTIDYPSPYNPDIRILNTENLASLSLYYIGTNKAVDDAADLIFRLRHQLKTLRIHLPDGWEPEVDYDNGSDEARNDAFDYSMARIKDRCYPLIYRFVMADEPEPMKLDELEIQGVPDDFVTENWIRTFDFHSIQRLTLIHRHFYFDEGATEFWTYLRESKISFKMIKTDCENEPLDQFISSFEGLEALYLLDYDKRWSTLSSVQFAGHFHSLRRFFYPNNIHGMSFYSHNVLRSIIANCPLLEELGMYIEGEGSIVSPALPLMNALWEAILIEKKEATFKVLDESPCLKRLYITCATRGEGDYSSYPYFNHDEFLEIFYAYFAYSRPVESAFLNRLEVLSYYRTLWEIVPIDLDDSELADMQEELNYEPLSDGELEDLIQDHKPAENELYVREKEKIDWPGGAETAEEGSEDNSDGHDFDFSWVTQPSCYTWERAAHGFNRVPLRVSWMDYRDDELAWTVYQWVLGEDGVFKRGLFRKPPWLDDWADESDVGMDGYGVPREESEEEEGEENTDEANEAGEEEEGADEEGD